MKKRHSITMLAVASMPLIAFNSLGAAIEYSGDFSAGTGMISFTEEIFFDVTDTTQAAIIVFDEIAFSGGIANASSPDLLQYQIVGNVSSTTDIGDVVDRYDRITGDINDNDGYISFQTFSVMSGDTLIIPAQSFSVAAISDFDLPVGNMFDGDIFLATAQGIRISENAVAAVPEPSTYAAIIGIFTLGFVYFRRTRKTQ